VVAGVINIGNYWPSILKFLYMIMIFCTTAFFRVGHSKF
jgi:hypothetical protein